MSQTDNVFAGSIPAIYDRYMAPMFFAPYAADLAERLRNVNAGHLLEIAAGTGVVTRVLARSLPQTVSIIATDLNQPMVDFAAAQTNAARITWRQADALHLPFPAASFDIVICQFGVMFFPDKVAAYREVHRVLRPGGRFIFTTWDRIEQNEITLAVSDALAELFPGNPPRFMTRTPHGYHDCERIQEELRAAGFSRIEAETQQLRSCAPSARDAAIGLCQGSPLRNEIEERNPGGLAEATEVASRMIAKRLGSGRIDAKMQAFIFTASK
ncbi:MAG: class I SAM-dependent methyltransferase [Acidobacteriia bacterium]|nr:class I SAM-dependent methyltransferase [Terriglobia bacterium]